MQRTFTVGLSVSALSILAIAAEPDPLPAELTYRPLPTMPFSQVKDIDEAQKPQVMARQREVLEARYDLSNQAMEGVMMSGGLKPVQDGVRVRLVQGQSWDTLANMTAQEILDNNLLPDGFKPLPHVKQPAGGQVFPDVEIDQIAAQEQRDLRRFDVDFDLPDHLTPEFPPPIFLTTHPELGDVSRGELLTMRNHYEIMNGLLTPVQMEGRRKSDSVWTPPAFAACSISRFMARSAPCVRSKTLPSSNSIRPTSTVTTSALPARASTSRSSPPDKA